MFVDFRKIVAHSVDHVLIEPFQLRGSFLWGDIEGQLLGPVEKQFHAPEARLFWFEHEAPAGFGNGLGAIRCRGNIISYLSRDFVRSDSIASGPGFDDFNVIGSRSVNSCHAIVS